MHSNYTIQKLLKLDMGERERERETWKFYKDSSFGSVKPV